jgi:hypothetical protein
VGRAADGEGIIDRGGGQGGNKIRVMVLGFLDVGPRKFRWSLAMEEE